MRPAGSAPTTQTTHLNCPDSLDLEKQVQCLTLQIAGQAGLQCLYVDGLYCETMIRLQPEIVGDRFGHTVHAAEQ